MSRFVLASLVTATHAVTCPFTGGDGRTPTLPRAAKCNNLGPMYLQGGGFPFKLAAPANGDCVYGVAGGACSGMPLGNIERIEIDVSVSKECQQKTCNHHEKGDWVALWMEPQQLGIWNKNREVDIMETVYTAGKTYVGTNFDNSSPHQTDWGLHAPFAAHVTLTTHNHADGGLGVYVAHCRHGSSSCKTGPGVKGNAYKTNMEREIVYRIVVDNWGNQCSKTDKGSTPGCTVSVDKLDVTLKGAPPAPGPPGTWAPCSQGDVCCNPNVSPRQVCPGGAQCHACGGGNACRCPAAAANATMLVV